MKKVLNFSYQDCHWGCCGYWECSNCGWFYDEDHFPDDHHEGSTETDVEFCGNCEREA